MKSGRTRDICRAAPSAGLAALARGWRGKSGGAGPSGRVGGSRRGARISGRGSRNSLAIDADGCGTAGASTTGAAAATDGIPLPRARSTTAANSTRRTKNARIVQRGPRAGDRVGPVPRARRRRGRSLGGELGPERPRPARARRLDLGGGSAGERRCREGARCRDGLPRSAFALRSPQLPPVAAIAAGATSCGGDGEWPRLRVGAPRLRPRRRRHGGAADCFVAAVRGARRRRRGGGGGAGVGRLRPPAAARAAPSSCESGDDGYGGRLRPAPPPNAHGQLGRGAAGEPRRVDWEAAAFAARRGGGSLRQLATDGAATTWGWGCAQRTGRPTAPTRVRRRRLPRSPASPSARSPPASTTHSHCSTTAASSMCTGAGARLPVRALEPGGVATAVAAGYQHSLAIVNASGG